MLTVSSPQGEHGGLSHGAEVFALTNTSSRNCTLGGYPGLGLLDNGSSVPLTVKRQTNPGFVYAYIKPALLTIAPGQAASFAVEFWTR